MNSKPTPSTGKATRITLLFFFLISCLICWKFFFSQNAGTGNVAGGPGGKSGPLKVAAVVVSSVSLPLRLEFTGSLKAWEVVQIMPEAGGRVTSLNIREGQRVEKGTLLISLFDDDLRAQAEKLQLQEKIARRNLERCNLLLKSGSGTQQDADNAENQLNNIRADLKILEANLLKTKIIAPLSGEIGFCNISHGAWVNPGMPITTITDIRKIKVEFSVPERYSHLFEKGQQISFTGNMSNGPQKAGIYAIEPSLNESTRSLSIRAVFSNAGGKWKPGTFVKVKPDSLLLKDAVMIPSQSIIPDNKGKKVIVYHNGKAEFREIQTGIRTKDNVQVVTGIMSGDTVLTSGLMFVKPASDLILTQIERKQ